MIEVPILATERHGGRVDDQLPLGRAAVPRRLADDAVSADRCVRAHDAAVARPGAGRWRSGRAPAQAERSAARVRGRFWEALDGRVPAGHARVRAPGRGASPDGPADAPAAAPPVGPGRRRAERVTRREHAQPEPARRARPAGRGRGPAARPGAHRVPSRARLYLHDLALRRRRAARERRRPERRRPARRRAAPSASGGRRRSRREAGPDFSQNYLQLNSIAAGPSLAASFFSASAERISARRPGPPQLPGRRPRRRLLGRDARAGRARPDAAALGAPARRAAVGRQPRLRRARRRRGRPLRASRGCRAGRAGSRFHGDVAFVGTSRVIPRFRMYAPGLDLDRSRLRRPRGRHPDAARCSARWSGRTATRSSPSRRCRCSLTSGFPPPATVRRRCTLHNRPELAMSDFRLLMIGAMYENGGNTTHRFLDGHPQLYVYPFESQLGTRLVNDHALVDVPGQVPLARVRARRDARGRTTTRSSTRSARCGRGRRT